MRDVNRIPRLISKVAKVWNETPDMRLFQFVSYLASVVYKNAEEKLPDDAFFWEDDKIEKAIDNYISGATTTKN